MSHPDQDLLADLALGEPVPTETSAHVSDCAVCSADLESLRMALEVARAPRPELVGVPADVWGRVTSVIDESESGSTADGRVHASGLTPVQYPAPPETDLPPVAVNTDEVAARRTRPARRRVGLGWVACAAAAGIVFGAVGVKVVADEEAPPAPVTVASTSLDTLDTLQARGSADLLRSDGQTDLVVRTEPIDPDDGYLEVWLINRDGKRMVSVGVLPPGQTDQTFAIPQSLIEKGYVIVDISREGYDDKPQHSGDSVVRGTLPA